MKKFLTFILCIGAAATISAAPNTPVTLAKKAKTLDEARSLIKEAIADPQYNQDAETFYEAGMIETKAFDKDQVNRMLNTADSTLGVKMSDELINAYNYFVQAFPLDTIVDDKGKTKTKYSGKMYNEIYKNRENFFNAGIEYNMAQKYYPESYNAFMIYGNLPSGILKDKAKDFNPQQVITAFFNAGVVASLSNQLEAAADAYRLSRLAGSDSIDVYRYEIGSLIGMIQENNDRANELQPRIEEVALAGINKFGIDEPLFINNYINSLINHDQPQQALDILNNYIAQYPENSNLYGLQGWVYEQMDNDDLSEAAYRKGASLSDKDVTTLKNAALKLFKIGTKKNNDLEGSAEETNEERQNIKNNYFLVAQQYAQEAAKIDPTDPTIQSLLDSLDYSISLLK